MANRARELQLDLSDDMIKAATTRIKNLADQRTVTLDQVCPLVWCSGIDTQWDAGLNGLPFHRWMRF